MKDTLGFIGLGALGSGMAKNLLTAGYRLIGNDLDAAKVAGFTARGAQAAATAAEVARQAAISIETTAQRPGTSFLGPTALLQAPPARAGGGDHEPHRRQRRLARA
jgi:phosphoglycerate dehydrogenase-like enzyme